MPRKIGADVHVVLFTHNRKKRRKIGADGWNSFWHFAFGALGVFYWWVIPIFFAYQLKEPYETNVAIDLSEFVIGFVIVWAFLLIVRKRWGFPKMAKD
jgi:hypothetical protein